ncbi:MAG: SHOCT domain-containing protein [Planctomycetota bacterium]
MIGALSLGGTGGARSFDALLEILPWLAALVVLLGVGAVAIYVLRRFLSRSDQPSPDGFTLQQLRDLHASGALSDEEFERARASIIGRYTETHAPEKIIGPEMRGPDSTHERHGK